MKHEDSDKSLIQVHGIISLIRRIKSLALLFHRFKNQLAFLKFLTGQKWGQMNQFTKRQYVICYIISSLCTVSENRPKEAISQYTVIMENAEFQSSEARLYQSPFFFCGNTNFQIL